MNIQTPSAIETHREFLRNEGWLARMPEEFRNAILSKSRLKICEAGTTILNVGEEPRGLFGLAAGRLRVAIAPGETAPLFAHLFKPGDWFGEVPALTQAHHVTGLITTRDSVLLHVPNHALGDILREDTSRWRHLGQLAVEHLQLSLGVVADLMLRDHTKRFMAILLRLGGCRQAPDPQGQTFEVDFSQDEIATVSNLARTTVNALIKKLQKDGLIYISYRRIQIVNPAKMRNLISD